MKNNSKFAGDKTELNIQSQLANLNKGDRFDAILNDDREVSGILISFDGNVAKFTSVGTVDEAQIKVDDIKKFDPSKITPKNWR